MKKLNGYQNGYGKLNGNENFYPFFPILTILYIIFHFILYIFYFHS